MVLFCRRYKLLFAECTIYGMVGAFFQECNLSLASVRVKQTELLIMLSFFLGVCRSPRFVRLRCERLVNCFREAPGGYLGISIEVSCAL